MTTSGMIYVILIGAIVFNGFCAKTMLPQAAASWVSGLRLSSWLIIMAIMAIYFLMGMVMEAPSIQILTLPVFYPIVVHALGYDPIWFGVVQIRHARDHEHYPASGHGGLHHRRPRQGEP